MGCFRCAGKSSKKSDTHNPNSPDKVKVDLNVNDKKEDKNSKDNQLSLDANNLGPKRDSINAKTFTFNELAAATGNFRPDSFLGEGGFGKVYKGHLERINEVVAIKQLDPHGLQGAREFVVEVITLSSADHPNLVKLTGFCAEGDERLLVYEYMPLGSLENHLHDLKPGQKPIDWYTRMKIAAGAARGLEYLHDKMTPPARPLFRDRRRFTQMIDPLLEGEFPVRGLYQALAIAAMCVQEQPNMRPAIADVVTALSYLASQKHEDQFHSARHSRDSLSSPRTKRGGHRRFASSGSETDKSGE
ncbi:unnamed protein product [Lupinus luteus]|uniref:Protein kinase domain-containing protein n=1 Tax=Lupinus luteus TaxID=3873 RepID=A0AAV1YH41_LUPLU